MVRLTAFFLISSAFGYPANFRSNTHRYHGIGLSPSRQWFALPWFKKSLEDKDDGDPEFRSEFQLSETEAGSLSDAATMIESFISSNNIGKRSESALEELSNMHVEGLAVDGKIKVRFNGQQIPIGVEIDETYLKDVVSEKGKRGVDELCSGLADAMRDAHYKSGVKVEEKMKSLYSDLEFES